MFRSYWNSFLFRKNFLLISAIAGFCLIGTASYAAWIGYENFEGYAAGDTISKPLDRGSGWAVPWQIAGSDSPSLIQVSDLLPNEGRFYLKTFSPTTVAAFRDLAVPSATGTLSLLVRVSDTDRGFLVRLSGANGDLGIVGIKVQCFG